MTAKPLKTVKKSARPSGQGEHQDSKGVTKKTAERVLSKLPKSRFRIPAALKVR